MVCDEDLQDTYRETQEEFGVQTEDFRLNDGVREQGQAGVMLGLANMKSELAGMKTEFSG